jgi:hypothetical protein
LTKLYTMSLKVKWQRLEFWLFKNLKNDLNNLVDFKTTSEMKPSKKNEKVFRIIKLV